MVKPRRKMSSSYCYSEKSPQFFKIYVPDHCSQRLRIPPAFIKYFKGVMPFNSILRSPAKRSWHVEVNKVNNCFFFQKGWQEFVQDYSLKFGDFLIFCYNGNSEFHVSVFGKNSCQKEVAITTVDSAKQLPLLQGNQMVEPGKPNESTCLDSPEPIRENIEALETPCKSDSKNPFFEIVLRPSYVSKGFMNVPAEFVKRYMCTHRRTARLEHSNKSWAVNLIRKRNRLVFSGGWAKFVAANTLQEGDVCSFELISRDDYVFNVAIRKEQSTKFALTNGEEVAEMTPHPGDPLENQEDVGALDDSGKLISKYPFFQIDLTPNYVLGGSLNIPAEFRRRYMNKRKVSATLQHSNKWWRVKLTGNGRNRLYVSGGWPKFVKEIALQAGDICRFELIERDKYVFNVSISSGNNNGTPTKA